MPYDGDVKWVPVSAAAARLGISRTRVYQLLEEGALLSIKVDSTVLVSLKSCDGRLAERGREARNVA